MKSVPIDRPAQVKVRARTRTDDTPSARGDVTFRRADSGAEIDRSTIAIEEGHGSLEWTACGLKDEEMECTVQYTIYVEDEIVAQGDLRVYRVELKVNATDTNGEPIEGARCRMILRPHSDVATQYGIVRPRSVEATTDADGRLEFKTVPGKFELQWLSPWNVERWDTDTGPARAVVLEPVEFVARFLDPVAGDHNAWVNEPAAADDPLRGHELTVTLGGFDPGDASTPTGAGAQVYVKVTRNVGSRRFEADLVRPGLQDLPLPAESEVTQTLTLDDAHTAKLSLDLGHGGGDVFTIAIGSTPACLDQTMTVTTWRTLYVQLYFAADPDALDVEAMLSHVQEALHPANIKVVFPPYKRLPADPSVTEVDAERARAMGLKPGNLDRLTVFTTELDDAHPMRIGNKPELLLPHPPSDNRARINVVVFNLIVARHRCRVETRWRGRQSGWRAFPVPNGSARWVPFFFDSPPNSPPSTSLVPYRPHARAEPIIGVAKARLKHGIEQVDLQAEDFEFKVGRGQYRVRANIPGLWKATRVEAWFGMYYLSGQGGSASGSRVALAWSPRDTPATVGHALTHELGHSLDQTPSDMRDFPGVTDPHPTTYQFHGHSGPHCYAGLANKHQAKDDYQKLTDRGTHGNCVMWGGVSPKFDYAKAKHFCPDCTRFLKATRVAF